jgi:ribosomal protein S16
MKISKIFTLLMIAICSIFIQSCKHELNYPDYNPNPIDTTTPPPVDTLVCFESQILPLFVSNCAMSGCHDADSPEENIQLTDYTHIRQEIIPYQPSSEDVMEAIIDGSMPPSPNSNLTSSQISLIQQWISQGAQNTTNCAIVCDSTAYTYSADISPIMSTFCNGCHGGAFPSAGINTSSWAGLQSIANNDSLMGSIQHDSGFSPMPKGSAKMNACNITKIRKWIQAGALNN